MVWKPERPATARPLRLLDLVVARRRDDALLVDRRRCELEAVPPDDVLHVVRVGPQCVEHVVGADGKVGVVADAVRPDPGAWLDARGHARPPCPAAAGRRVRPRYSRTDVGDVAERSSQ